ncbi:MAG TPA: protein TolR [Thermoanaerobaculia bacterium]|jgi:biopolymer transport protein TolR|nr:protein TolR [Thermoanaerobaculia bacterium]
MAFQLGEQEEDGLMADINVTPLVDVMLVLLIIFMVAAPMLHQGIEVKLPQAAAQNLPLRVEDPLILSIRRDGLLYLRETPVAKDALVAAVQAEIAAKGDASVFLKGDRDVPYGQVIEVLDLLYRGGIQNVGLVTEPNGRDPKGRGGTG